MSEKEVIDWFWNKYNSCYPVTHSDYPESVFLFYDKQFIRKIKLCKISGKKIKYPSKITGICLFEQDWKNKYFLYDYDEIYSFLKSNLSDNYQVIKDFIIDRLKEADKFSVLTPIGFSGTRFRRLKEADKFSVLTPNQTMVRMFNWLKEADKFSVLTPDWLFDMGYHWLKEADKFSVLTPQPNYLLQTDSSVK